MKAVCYLVGALIPHVMTPVSLRPLNLFRVYVSYRVKERHR